MITTEELQALSPDDFLALMERIIDECIRRGYVISAVIAPDGRSAMSVARAPQGDVE